MYMGKTRKQLFMIEWGDILRPSFIRRMHGRINDKTISPLIQSLPMLSSLVLSVSEFEFASSNIFYNKIKKNIFEKCLLSLYHI